VLNCRRHDSADLETACRLDFTIGRVVKAEQDQKAKGTKKDTVKEQYIKVKLYAKQEQERSMKRKKGKK